MILRGLLFFLFGVRVCYVFGGILRVGCLELVYGVWFLRGNNVVGKNFLR